MYYALQQSLVAHHHGGLSAIVNAFSLFYPLSYVSCLHVLCCGRCECDILRFGEVAVYVGIVGVEFVGEIGQILLDIVPSLGGYIICVEVPVELGFSLLLQF